MSQTEKSPEQRHEERVVRHLSRCKHFDGIQHERCRQGVPYDQARDTTTQPYGFACLSRGAAACSLRELPTRAEAEAEIAESDARFMDTVTARTAAVADLEARGAVAGSGTVACPRCGGTLHYSRAAVNGHVWGACETPDCLRWME